MDTPKAKKRKFGLWLAIGLGLLFSAFICLSLLFHVKPDLWKVVQNQLAGKFLGRIGWFNAISQNANSLSNLNGGLSNGNHSLFPSGNNPKINRPPIKHVAFLPPDLTMKTNGKAHKLELLNKSPLCNSARFPEVVLKPKQEIQIQLSYPASQAGHWVAINAQDGGTISFSQGRPSQQKIASDGTVNFQFDAGTNRGIYEIQIATETGEVGLPLWVETMNSTALQKYYPGIKPSAKE